jgi:hypothetical protein
MPPARSGTSPSGLALHSSVGVPIGMERRSARRGDRIGWPACRAARRFLLPCVLLRAMCHVPAEVTVRRLPSAGCGVYEIWPAAEDPGRVDDARPSASRNATPRLAFQYGCGAATGVNPPSTGARAPAPGRCRRRVGRRSARTGLRGRRCAGSARSPCGSSCRAARTWCSPSQRSPGSSRRRSSPTRSRESTTVVVVRAGRQPTKGPGVKMGRLPRSRGQYVEFGHGSSADGGGVRSAVERQRRASRAV